MNVRALAAFGCLVAAFVAVEAPAYAVRVAVVGLAVVVGGVLLEAILDALRGVTAARPVPLAPPPATPVRAAPAELVALQRELSWAPPQAPMPDVVFASLQGLARRRVRTRLRLVPEDPADHAAIARRLPPALFTLVMSGLVAPEATRPGDRLVVGYVPYDLRPPMWALGTLLEQLEAL